MEFRLLYITAANREEAEKIANALVEERLAACANILGEISSVYWWQGKLTKDREVAFTLKTRADLVDAAIARVKALHSYTIPCVVALPLVAGNPDYFAWLAQETTPRSV
jgi:periplasmic divalent cation tolerance protein